jgi:hypothetical protein
MQIIPILIMAVLDTAIAGPNKEDARVKRGHDELGEDWEEKLFLLWGLWNSCGFHHWLLLEYSFVNQHSSAQPMGFGAAFRAAIFFPHPVSKVSNALITACNHIIHKCHVHHHRVKFKQMRLYAIKWCSAQ